MKLLERTAAGPDGAIEALSTRLLQRGFVPDDRTPAANTAIRKVIKALLKAMPHDMLCANRDTSSQKHFTQLQYSCFLLSCCLFRYYGTHSSGGGKPLWAKIHSELLPYIGHYQLAQWLFNPISPF